MEQGILMVHSLDYVYLFGMTALRAIVDGEQKFD